MNRIQQVSFRNVQDFLDHLPEEEREIVEFLRHLILQTIPDCTEKLAYNVPFYYRRSRVCFLWPAAIPWGGIQQGEGVQLGFCQGFLLPDSRGYLERGNRKEVASRTFTNPKEIDSELLRTYLFDAVQLDEVTRKAKNQSFN